MPRKQRDFEAPARPVSGDLVDKLADELKNNHESGQPMIDERVFPSKKLRVTVIWDDWDRLSLEDRTAVILEAYEQAEDREYRSKIALASGLTMPEAYAAGFLPCSITAALRRNDPVTLEECHRAMIDEGASLLFERDRPQLRFATMEEAEASKKRLIQQLPGSEEVWQISREVMAFDHAMASESSFGVDSP